MTQRKEGCFLAKKSLGNRQTEARKAMFILKSLDLVLVEEPVKEGITLTLKIIRMQRRNHKFIEALATGKSLGRMDPFSLLFLSDAPNFIMLSSNKLREKIGDMLQIECPGKLYVTKDLLKDLSKFKLLTGYVDVGKTYGRECFEISPGVYEIFGE